MSGDTYLDDLRTRIRNTRDEFAAAVIRHNKALAALDALSGRSTKGAAQAQKKKKPSRKVQLHGQYIGLMSGMPEAKRKRVKRIRALYGVERAIKLARQMRGL